MGACVTTPPEQTPQQQETCPISKPEPKPKPKIDYFSNYPWSKIVVGIISYWNRETNSLHIQLNKDVESMIQRFCLNDLILKEWSIVTFKSDELYEFSNIIIKQAILTVEPYDINTNPNGGKLLLKSYGDFIIEPGGVIDVIGKGYSGGQRWFCGLSFRETAINNEKITMRRRMHQIIFCIMVFIKRW